MVTVTIKRWELYALVILVAIAAVAFGILIGTPNHAAHTKPDWTVASCSLWADTEFPKLPKYTIPNLCVNADGSISKASN